MNWTKLRSLIFSLALTISLTSCDKKVKEIIVRQVDPHYQEELENLKQELKETKNIKARDGRDGRDGDKGDKGDKGDAGRDGVNGKDGRDGVDYNNKIPPRPMPTPPLNREKKD